MVSLTRLLQISSLFLFRRARGFVTGRETVVAVDTDQGLVREGEEAERWEWGVGEGLGDVVSKD